MDPVQFEKFINHWCPAGWHHEPLNSRLARALMNAVACVASCREVMEGKRPIRPLEDFPNPVYPEGGIGL